MAELTESLGIGSDNSSKPASPERPTQTAPEPGGDAGEADGAMAAMMEEEDETPAAEAGLVEDETSGEDATGPEAADGSDPEQEPKLSDDHADAEPAAPEPTAEEAAATMDDEALDALARERKWPRSYLRRIRQLTSKAKAELEARDAEIGRLQEQMEELRKAPSPAQPAVTDLEQNLESEIAAAERVIDFVDDNPEGGRTPDNREWSREELRAERRKAERLLRAREAELLALRQNRTARQREVDALMPTRHPALKDRTSEHSRAMDALLSRYPVLKSDPVLRLMASDATAWTLQAAAKARPVNGTNGTNGHGPANGQARPGPAAPPPRATVPGPARPQSAVPAVNGQRAAVRQSEKRFFEEGDPEAGSKLLESVLFDG